MTIKLNENYKPEDHPKLYLSQKAENFEAIFTLLKIAPVHQLDQIYSLFKKLPVNPSLKSKFLTLDSVKSAESPEQKQLAWNELLDPSCFYHLLFCLSIVNSTIQKDPAYSHLFIEAGGLKQLLQCILHLNIQVIDSMLKLKCLKDLTALTLSLLAIDSSVIQQVDSQAFLKRVLCLAELLCDFSIRQETQRGYTYEHLQNKIKQEGQKKYLARLH